jgi:hypothetical protein
MTKKIQEDFNPEFPFSSDVFLSNEPMTDEEFKVFMTIKNDEIPIESVSFSYYFHRPMMNLM